MGIDEYIQMLGREEGIKIGMKRGIRKGIKQGIKIGIEMGIEKSIEKGREEERRALVENLLAGTEFSDEKIASLANVEE